MTNKEIAKHVFARNPKVTELYITSDKKAFYEEHSADAYAQRLKDRKVIKMERDSDDEIDVTPKGGSDTITNTAAAVGGKPKEIKEDGGQGESGDQGDNGSQVKKLEDMKLSELKEIAENEEVDLSGITGQLSIAKVAEAINKKRAENQEFDLSKMSQEELVAYGKETFDLELKADAPAEELVSTLNDHIKALEANEDK